MTDTNQELTLTTTEVIETPNEAGIGGFFSKEGVMNFLPIVLIFAVFYFFIIRPQIKKQKTQEALIKSSKKGDKVIVAGGIIGKIIKEKEGNIIVLEIAKNVQIEALKSSIISFVGDKKETVEAKKK